MTRPLSAALLLLFVLLGWSWVAVADDDDDDDGGFGPARITDLYVFGDSLSDTGNLFALTFSVGPPVPIEPPSPPYFDGRFSDGPVWVETLAPLLGLVVDFDTDITMDPLANNQAVAGALTDFRNEAPSLNGTGILGQVASFEAAGGRIGRRDLVVIWGGANNYLFDPAARPRRVVADLVDAVERLSDLGARRFLLPNLPDLGRIPLGALVSTPEVAAVLSAQSRRHNRILARAAARLADGDLAVQVLDVEQGLDALLDAGTVFANTAVPCLIQQPDGSRVPTGACPPLGTSFDAGALGGTLFWDLVHPSTNAHALIAFQAFGTITGGGSADEDLDWLAMR